MDDREYEQLLQYAKQFSGVTEDMENTLQGLYERVKPHMAEVTDSFYTVLLNIPKAEPFLIDRLDALKETHISWMESVFSGPFDLDYVKAMYRVGDVHVKAELPVEFMAGSMALITTRLHQLLGTIFKDEPEKLIESVSAVNAILGFTLMVMQQSYESSRLAEELEKFLKITGMSRTLFDNLASAYKE
ncbi:MAG: protoglobin domain-containing protein [Candidatus Thiodiazotropha taylori]|nr:protoglobin domain-containing protein [Candidatus Thiodiazotropha taylori]